MNNVLLKDCVLLKNRIEFVMLFDVTNGNPNGDPNAGNMPRMDMETNFGIISDVCIKRKIRNYVLQTRAGVFGYNIYITDGAVLNDKNKLAYEACGEDYKKVPKDKSKITRFMTENYFDIRAFGAVMSNNVNAGTVVGPVQLTFPVSVDPVMPQPISITRMAVTNEKDAEKEHTFGDKWIVPYGLYRMEGYISASYAERFGFTEDDLELLWEALINMFELDHSAARGKMNPRKLVVFKHQSKYGNCPAQKLFDLVTVKKVNPDAVPRKYEDYIIEVNKDAVPENVEVSIKYE